jgi:hypothetical protein
MEQEDHGFAVAGTTPPTGEPWVSFQVFREGEQVGDFALVMEEAKRLGHSLIEASIAIEDAVLEWRGRPREETD